MKHFLIDIIAFTTIISNLLVITSKNPVISVVFLVSLFINAACYLILIGVGFIGISYIIVYIGAIAVLFLFVIMMINIEVSDVIETGAQYTKTLPLALSVGFLFIYEIYNIIPFSFNNLYAISSVLDIFFNFNWLILDPELIKSTLVYMVANPIIADTHFLFLSQIETIGQIMYTDGSFGLIICSVILLLAMIAPIFIGRKPKI
jgi:NADH-ubiquinone oxidoreductase chain 6